MDFHQQLTDELDLALRGLPPASAPAYVAAGRAARRRRRRVTVAAAACTCVVIGLGASAVVGATGSDRAGTTSPATAPDPSPTALAPEPANHVVVQEGLGDVDSFTTEAIPSWAQEHGNHGPCAIAPDGRLWVAPGTVVTRIVADPWKPGKDGDVVKSYAVETRTDGELTWGILYLTTSGHDGGVLDEPGTWTDDFALWVDQTTAHLQGRPSIGARLVGFADSDPATLVGKGEARVVRQRPVTPGTSERHPVTSAAEVVWGGRTWYVYAADPEADPPFYLAYEAEIFDDDFDAFVADLESTEAGGRL